MNNHIQINKENLHENLHEILRQTWNREISADDALELLEDTLSEVMEANRLLKNTKESVLGLTAEGMESLDRAKTAEVEITRLRYLMDRLCGSVAENWDEGIAEYFKDEMNK